MNFKEARKRVINLTKHFGYSEFQINLLTISYAAIVNFDSEVEDIIEYVLATKYILFASADTIKRLAECYPDVNNGDIYELPSFDSNRRYEDDFIVIRTKLNRSLRDYLDIVIHELKHTMNTIVNSYDKSEDNAYLNCGLAYVDLKNRYYFKYLEEAFNSYMTYLYLKVIEHQMKHDKSCKEISSILDCFNMTLYQYAYAKVAEILEPMFKDKELFRLFYNAALYKDYDSLYDVLELKFGRSVFYLFDNLLTAHQEGRSNIIEYYLDAIGVRR